MSAQTFVETELKPINTNKLFKIFSFILVITGLIISAYLFYQHYLLVNEANGKADVCYALFGKGCARALSSTVAVQLGLPLAGWGIIYYTVMALLLSVFFKNKSILIPVFAISVLGCISSIALLVMIYFDHSLFCPFCIVIHGINILLLFGIIKITGYSFGGFVRRINNEIILFFDFRLIHNNKKSIIRWRGIGFYFLIVFFLYALLQVIIKPGKIVFDAQKFVKEFDNTPPQKIIVDDEDHVMGAADSPVQIIVFSDFECPACRNFSKVITWLGKKYSNKFYVVFKNFPLGKECNPVYGDYDLHPKACEAARAAEAAGLQGKFWQYHDVLFSLNLEKTNETFLLLAAKIGLDQTQFEKDRKDTIVINRLAKTIYQGKQLGVKGTPTVFFNGHLINDSRLRHMQVLMDHLLNPGLSFLIKNNIKIVNKKRASSSLQALVLSF